VTDAPKFDVERARKIAKDWTVDSGILRNDVERACDEIERLRGEVSALYIKTLEPAEKEDELIDSLRQQLDAQAKRIEGLRVALKEIVKNERGGEIPSITSMIASDALTTDKEHADD
jgi:hypothetical protein